MLGRLARRPTVVHGVFGVCVCVCGGGGGVNFCFLGGFLVVLSGFWWWGGGGGVSFCFLGGFLVVLSGF